MKAETETKDKISLVREDFSTFPMKGRLEKSPSSFTVLMFILNNFLFCFSQFDDYFIK